MRKLIICLLLIVSFGGAKAQYNANGIPVFNSITDLKKQSGIDSAIVYVAGGQDITDFRGAFYRYLASSTATEDNTYFGVVKPTSVTTGRWMRVNQTTINYPQGTLFRIGLLKIFVASSTTNAQGESTLNLTTDNTTNGTSIFANILYNMSMAITPATTANDVVSSSVKVQANTVNMKYTTHRYAKGSLGVLGIATLSNPANNTPVQFFIVGL